MARLREFDDDAAMAAIEAVFWEKGFDGASYADLTAATGLGKGSLYAAFGNKQSLYLKALEAYIVREVETLGAALVSQHQTDPSTWRAGLKAFFNVAIEAISKRKDRRGCFLCNAAVDLAPHNKDVEDIVKTALSKVKEALALILADHVAPSLLEAKVEHMLAVYLGMRVMAKAGASQNQLTMTRDAALASL